VSDKSNVDPGFWSRADAYVNLANEHCNHAIVGEVRASLLFAAARFNTFTVASQAPNGEALKAGAEHAIDYFMDEFRKMLEENFRDQVQNFDAYFKRTKGTA
jgi:Protein of unknown function (DUF3144)